MNILFLNPPFGSARPEGLDAPLGIMYLSAALAATGHACACVDNAWERRDDWSRWEAAVGAGKPDVVIVNTQLRFTRETMEALRRLRRLDTACRAVAIGPQASTEPARLLTGGFDACVIGEPETVLPELFAQSAPPAQWGPRDGLATLNDPHPKPAPRADVEFLPFPDWNIVNYGRYIATTHNAVVMASRGLDYPDTFNQPPLIYAATPTRRCSVDRVVRELAEVRRRFTGRYMVLFHDEVFTEERSWVIELCDKLRAAQFGFHYWCFTRPDLVDAQLCRIMARCGFAGVSMGMESGADRVLEMLGRNTTVEKIEAGFRAARIAGLLTVGSVMIGTPGRVENEPDETWQEIESTARLVKKIHPDVLTITITTPLPGTSMYESAAGRINAEEPEAFNYLHTFEGKYPVRLKMLGPNDLARGAALIRRAWKRGLWKTAVRMVVVACNNGPFRKTMIAQAFRAFRKSV